MRPLAHDTYEILPGRSTNSVLVTVEHAGVRVPEHLGGMGIPEDELLRHIGWDIGTEGVARKVNDRMNLVTILGRYSRLVVDLNRPESAGDIVLETSDTTMIPANRNLCSEIRQERILAYHRPFHDAVSDLIANLKPVAALSIHSFTPVLRSNRIWRPWHCGILFDGAESLARSCLAYLNGIEGLAVGENEPYKANQRGADKIPLHTEYKGIPTILIEIRNDLVRTQTGQHRWSEVISGMLRSCFGVDGRGQHDQLKPPDD